MTQISIIVPIYNVEPYLKQCLDSVAEQTCTDIEVLCIDDGSTDSSGAICDEYAAKNCQFKVIHKRNAGYGAAVNTGLKLANGAYIGIVEPDDYLAPTMFEKLIESANTANFPDVVKSAYWRITNANTPQECTVPCYYLHKVAHVGVPFSLAEDAEVAFHHPSIWSAIYRSQFLSENGIRMKEVPGAGWTDNLWMIETLTQAKNIVYIDEPLYYYREFSDGSSSNVKDPSIIWSRWLEMDDYLRNRKITEPVIIEAHLSRGCSYIEMLNNDFSGLSPKATSEVKQGIKNMIQRIDFKTVCHSSKILPNYKYAYLRHFPVWKRVLFKLRQL